tara:strand:- start:45 stop:230 length:186 start_codon:yes stop_codon:yes gene_type:complete
MNLTDKQKAHICDVLFLENYNMNDGIRKMVLNGEYDSIAIKETKEEIEFNNSILKVLEAQL